MTNNLKTGKEKLLRILITIIRHDCSHGLNRRDELLSHDPTYPIEQNRTKNQSNPIELQSFDWVGQSNKIEHLFCCEFDFRTNRTNIIEQNRTKSN